MDDRNEGYDECEDSSIIKCGGFYYWPMKNGFNIRLVDMDITHLKNTINMVKQDDWYSLTELEEELEYRKQLIKYKKGQIK